MAQAKRVGDVVVNSHVGVQCVVLEDHSDIAAARGYFVHYLVVQQDLALGSALQPGYHTQSGGLPAARRANQHHELAVLHHKIELVNGDYVAESLGQITAGNCAHRQTPRFALALGPGDEAAGEVLLHQHKQDDHYDGDQERTGLQVVPLDLEAGHVLEQSHR